MLQPGQAAYLFLADYKKHAKGDVAGLDIETGDRLCKMRQKSASTNGNPYVTPICRPATATDIVAYQNRFRPAGRRPKRELVPVVFRKAVGRYRAREVAGFPPEIARQYCEGYMHKGQKVGAVADYYVEPSDLELDAPAEDAPKPRPVRRRKPRRKVASMDEEGAPEKK